MKKLVFILLFVLSSFYSCRTIKPVVPGPSEQTIVHYIDSIVWHDSTVINYLPKEVYVEMVKPMDTLRLETSYAKSEAYLDTTFRALRGFIENKTDVPVRVEYKWKEKIVFKDSIQVVEKPYPVEITKEIIKYPKSYWFFLVFTVLTLAFIGFRLYLKYKKI